MLGAGRLCRGIALAALAALAFGCGDGGSSSEDGADTDALPVRDWEPSGAIAAGPGPGGPCRRVLVVGDSLAGETAPFVQATYDAHGYCAQVIDTAAPGTAPAAYHPTGTWTDVFRVALAAHTPDLVVSFFTGNGGPGLQADNFDATEAMIEIAREQGVPIYWVLPPLSAYPCDWDTALRDEGYRTYRRWVMEHLPGEVATVDGNVLTPAAGPTSGVEAYNDTLRVDGVERVVRDFDCVHLRDAGAELVAYEIVYATQTDWGVGA